MKRELSVRVVFLGIILSIVMGAANVYLGLKAGMTVSASIPAAVVAMVILRALFKNGTILEANLVQTAASAGESLAAGIIFTMPALIMIGVWEKFDMVMTTAIAFSGGLLGILFMIPMRKVFVVDNDELKFPEGVACAAVLKAGEADENWEKDHPGEEKLGAKGVIFGAVFGAGFKALEGLVGLTKSSLEWATVQGGRVFYFGSEMIPALTGVGVIVGLNISLLVFIGGAMGWLIGIPLMGTEGLEGSAVDQAWSLWSQKVRYIGVGAMVVGGVSSIIKVRGGLVQAVKQLRAGRKKTTDERDRDLPTSVIAALSVLAIGTVFGIYFVLTKAIGISLFTTVIMIVMSFFFTAVASYIVGLVGNSNSPVSGMTITAVLFTGFLLVLFGFTGEEGVLATLGVAAIVCCVACTAGDVCNDLKTGAIVGASPYRQQIMQVIGVAFAAFIMAPIMQLLHENTPGGIGGRELPAPQAGLFASLAEGMFAEGELPWKEYLYIGIVIGAAILIIDGILEKRKAKFRMHIMPVAVGIYLPFGITIPMLCGGVMAYFLSRGAKTDEEVEKKMQKGVLFSSGVIAGESLMGVGVAIVAAMGVQKAELGLPVVVSEILTLAAFAGMLFLFWKFSSRKQRV